MTYLFILNDLEMGRNSFSYDEILETLLKNSEWIFTNLKNFNCNKFVENDKIVLYGAGKARRYFVGTFEIASTSYDLVNKDGFYRYFDKGIKIKNVEIWDNPVYIKDVKEDLDFIKDKKNYGLHLRQTSRKLEEKDYNYLVNKARLSNYKSE